MAIQRLEQEKKIRSTLDETLNQLIPITSESLIRAKDLGTSLDFREGKRVFERTLKLFRDLNELNIDTISYNILNQLNNSATQALKQFTEIKNFDPASTSNPAQRRTDLINQIASAYDSYFQVISPIIAFSIRKGLDFEQLENNARNLVSKMEQSAQKQKELEKKTQKDINDTLGKVRRAAAEAGVAQHAIHFKEQAVEHIKKTKGWLISTAIFAGLTLIFGIVNAWYYTTHITELTNPQSIQLGISKLVIFSILYSAAFWTGRIYKSQWHNYVVNKHRQNALSTFETFVKAASDEQTKNAVLRQATQSIFSLQNSGFVTRGSDRVTSPQIFEIIKKVTRVNEQD